MNTTSTDPDSRVIVAIVHRHGRNITYESGTYLFNEGDASHHVYALVDGEIRIVRSLRSGRQLLLGIKHPGEEFGELSAVDGAHRAASAVATVPSVVARLSGKRFDKLVRLDPRLSVAVTHRLAAQLRVANERLRAQSSDSTVARAGHQLIELAVLKVKHSGVHERIELAMTQRDLADWIGATREATARSLAQLRTAGLVETSRGRIVITDIGALSDHLASA